MTKAVPALTEPTTITAAQGVVLETTIDPHSGWQMKRHLLSCDNFYKKTIRLVTKSANPNSFFEDKMCLYNYCVLVIK
jgi:hypothetical protein